MKFNDSKLFCQQVLINGEWLDVNNGEVIDVINLVNGDKLGSVFKMGVDEICVVIDVVNCVLFVWCVFIVKECVNILCNWFNLLMEYQDDLVCLMILEQGKLLVEVKGEISYVVFFIEWFVEEGKCIYGDIIFGYQVDKCLIVIKQLIGVIVVIMLWNFLVVMIICKVGLVLVVGCIMVLKFVSQMLFFVLVLAELVICVGILVGVFNVVIGLVGVVGNELISNLLVCKLLFIGLIEIGCQLMEQCVKDIKKVLLELGGNVLFIVFDDVDFDKVVEGVLFLKFCNVG